MIEYSDIRNTYSQFIVKKAEETALLRKTAVELLNEYVESLRLDKEFWVDSRGNHCGYVEEGVFGDDEFKSMPVARIALDDNYNLIFSIRTVVDDTSRSSGTAIYTDIKLSRKDDNFYVYVNDLSTPIIVLGVAAKGRFAEVSDKIKFEIVSDIAAMMPK
ncbi:hypothetical protein [Pectobacterium versatile]|uniref:hypothetical protein n=1 Tax=Pectobacterium versatile TaxID=2488639 RepID=UPI00102E3993|nr:hypothetical protein [Pectobacterium versatile]TAI93256.1 hypothetical protein EG332_22000 [Pectobacterium versatile]UEQ07714.1 hypothetical protein LLE50_12545 [Pectobacterium versatile]